VSHLRGGDADRGSRVRRPRDVRGTARAAPERAEDVVVAIVLGLVNAALAFVNAAVHALTRV